jgi:hypothetical protein
MYMRRERYKTLTVTLLLQPSSSGSWWWASKPKQARSDGGKQKRSFACNGQATFTLRRASEMAVVIGLENGQVLIFKVVLLPATCSSLTLATFAGASGFASNVTSIT